MSTTITTDQMSGVRPLADAECNHASGGNAALAVVGRRPRLADCHGRGERLC